MAKESKAFSAPAAKWKALLREKGINLDNPEEGVDSALHLAVWKGKAELVALLLKAGADPDRRQGRAGYTPLYLAALEGQKEIVELLLEAGADIEISDKDGRTALHMAISKRQQDIAELLLEAGADPDKQEGHGWTALHFTVLFGQAKTAKFLLDSGADMEIKTFTGRGDTEIGGNTAFDLAVCTREEKIVRLLADRTESWFLRKWRQWMTEWQFGKKPPL